MIKFTVWLKAIEIKGLRELAEKTGDKVAWHVRQAIDQYLKREQRK